MDERDAASSRLERRPRAVRAAVDVHLAPIGTHRARDDVHQGALAGAVLADQGVHLPGAKLEVHSVQGHRRAEPLREVAQLEHRPPPGSHTHGSLR